MPTMEPPSRRAPPPPSNPPPRNISRSGRVPPPKEAPSEGVRRARHTARRGLSPQALRGRTVRSNGAAGKRQDKHSASRRRDDERLSPSDERGLSAESSQESFEDSFDSENGRSSHPLPAVRRKAHRHSPRDGTESSDDSACSRGRRRHRRAQSRDRGRDRDGRVSSSGGSSSLSSDDRPGGREERREETRGGDGSRREGRERSKDRGRHSRRRKWRDTARSVNGYRHERNARSGSGSDSGSEEGYGIEKVSKRGSPVRRLGEIEDHRDVSGRTTLQDARSADKLDNGDTQSGTNSSSISETRGSESEGSTRDTVNTNRRRRRVEQDDNEAEGHGWSGNTHSWDSADDASPSGLSEQQKLSVLTSNGSIDDAVARKSIPRSLGADAADGEEKGALKQPTGIGLSSTTPPSRVGKESPNSKAWESEHEQHSAHEHKEGPSQSSGGRDVATAPTKTTSRTENVGKPIRGARWGEAIGVRSRVFDTSTIPTRRVDLKKFVSRPLRTGPGTVLRCFIERDRSGIHKFSNMFSMYADLEDGSGRMLLAARKLLASKTAYYIICIRQDDLFKDSGKRGGNSFLAKLRATSVAHTEYALYDRGDNPAVAAAEANAEPGVETKPKSVRNPMELARSKALRQHDKHEQGEFRRELGVIIYNFDKKEQRTGKRRMEVAIPQLQQEGESWEPVSWQPSETKESMVNNFGRIRYQGAQNFLLDDRLLVFHQRESRYDPLSSCLVDYRGRATAPSVKNFQLLKSPPEDNVKRAAYFSEGAGKDDCESDDLPRPVHLQMGKVGKDCFNVDLEWPLSILQAFAICLSRFDTQAHF